MNNAYQVIEVQGRGLRTGRTVFEVRNTAGMLALTCQTRRAAESRIAKLEER